MEPKIHKAVRGSLGRVIRGDEITEVEAVAEYAAGRDVVVCEGDTDSNRTLAQMIASAFGPYQRQTPHTRTAGFYALPHFQPANRPPNGHVFYETDHKNAALNP